MNAGFRRLTRVVGAALGAVAIAAAAAAQFTDFAPKGSKPAEPQKKVTVSVSPSKSAVVPGDQLSIAVTLDHIANWHTHTNDPVIPEALAGFNAIPTTVDIEAPASVTLGPVQWPEVYEVEVAFTGTPVMYGVFEGKATAYTPLLVGTDIEPGTTLTFTVVVGYQACDDRVCEFPQEETFTVELPVVTLDEAAAMGSDINTDPALFAGFDVGTFSRVDEWAGEAAAQRRAAG
ncbi:MAG: protein-disulfide reductase DsbD domain-containing protein, partial [Planctomycetota bacterium]|nr:protein-disulfide reductase DsbD domain-containing protein [Planctomycetota bacterium]